MDWDAPIYRSEKRKTASLGPCPQAAVLEAWNRALKSLERPFMMAIGLDGENIVALVDTPKARCRNAIVGANVQEQAAVPVS
jgi:hypothetical protein